MHATPASVVATALAALLKPRKFNTQNKSPKSTALLLDGPGQRRDEPGLQAQNQSGKNDRQSRIILLEDANPSQIDVRLGGEGSPRRRRFSSEAKVLLGGEGSSRRRRFFSEAKDLLGGEGSPRRRRFAEGMTPSVTRRRAPRAGWLVCRRGDGRRRRRLRRTGRWRRRGGARRLRRGGGGRGCGGVIPRGGGRC